MTCLRPLVNCGAPPAHWLKQHFPLSAGGQAEELWRQEESRRVTDLVVGHLGGAFDCPMYMHLPKLRCAGLVVIQALVSSSDAWLPQAEQRRQAAERRRKEQQRQARIGLLLRCPIQRCSAADRRAARG